MISLASNRFEHFVSYVGINGFADFEAKDSKDNILVKDIIKFSDITDCVYRLQNTSVNFQYNGTDYQYIWINNNTSDIVYTHDGAFIDKKGDPELSTSHRYWLNRTAEKYWTIYLLDSMEETLERDGFLSFNVYSYEHNTLHKFIEIGIGYIKFLYPGETDSVIYKFDDINRMYFKGTNLFIEHRNYTKKLFRKESGDKDGIPLLNLCNRSFFLHAAELLLGYNLTGR
jgi:hypothetical protein